MTAKYASVRCGHCKDCEDRPARRQVPKHKDRKKVLDMARNAVMAMDDKSPFRWNDILKRSFSAEGLANHLDADLAVTKHALHVLNLEGIVDRPSHSILHDSNRDPWNGGSFTGWQANIYRVIPESERKPRGLTASRRNVKISTASNGIRKGHSK